MGLNVAQKLIRSHLLSGAMTAGKEIGIRIDQTLTQDATGTLVMLELESKDLAAGFLASPVTAVSPGRRKDQRLWSRVVGRHANGSLGRLGVNEKIGLGQLD